MEVRVKIKATSLKSGLSAEVSSLLNTGYETEVPEIVLPLRQAERLGFWPKPPEGTEVKTYETAGGPVKMYYIGDAIEIQVITEDRCSKPVKCAVVISELEREVLLSDMTIKELGIIIESPKRGLWRFWDEEKAGPP